MTAPRAGADPLDLARELSAEWLGHGLAARPADRPRAEAAVTELYRLIGEPAPEFVWVPSPTAALSLVRDDPPTFPPLRLRDGSLPHDPHAWPVSARLATLAENLRDRLSERIGHRVATGSWQGPTTRTAEELLAAGMPVHAVTDAVVHYALRTTLHGCVRAPMRAELMPVTGGVDGTTWYGQHDAYWVARYDVQARLGLVTYPGRDSDRLGLFAELARSTGWWWPGQGRCVMAERPVEIHTEPLPNGLYGERRLHREEGPAVRFADDTQVHVLHGTHVPTWVVTAPTVERIHAERNVEVRRSAIERIGWGAYIEQARLRLVGTAADPGNPGSELHLYDVPRELWGRPARLLLAVNGSMEPDGTHRRYGLSVPAHFDDPVAAAGWTYGLSGEQYGRLVRRT
ncbi:DUF6745 domain-containing protein [Streptomyces graminofaciens]|uniref:DUF6745 domain-containing protein n=1 Tax=Streptomyces graminofaciens TaxID=68212 RepID=UPI0025748144|nr:hypothetical protein [Streptomyces graminofaciens]